MLGWVDADSFGNSILRPSYVLIYSIIKYYLSLSSCECLKTLTLHPSLTLHTMQLLRYLIYISYLHLILLLLFIFWLGVKGVKGEIGFL